MIREWDDAYRLDTKNTTYIFRKTKFGHLEHVYYGRRLRDDDSLKALERKSVIPLGSSILYNEEDENYCLDSMKLEWSDNGRGDYRQSPTEFKMPDGTFITDFAFEKHRIVKGNIEMKTLPAAYGASETLVVTLRDKVFEVYLDLYYTVYEDTDVITRRVVVRNEEEDPIVMRRIMSVCMDVPDKAFDLYTLDGNWIKEGHLHKRPLGYGITVNSSTTGASSNRHNPGFFLGEHGATEETGSVYGFNLVYSGNHYSMIEKDHQDYVRVNMGINPHCFEWKLGSKGTFETPEAVMTYSAQGFGAMSRQMHAFIRQHIVRGDWKEKERPVLMNSWEGFFFDFNEKKILKLAKQAKKIGVELFVLDDGWFGERNSDKAGLGDYKVNKKKLPSGLKELSRRIHRMGMEFGLWFEPEMVNEDSDLFRKHPEFAVRAPGRRAVKGRHQLVLDLCKKQVREYIIQNMRTVLDSAKVSYVKWDMNRHIAEAVSSGLESQGEFYHRYIIGLYEVLHAVFKNRPHILLETCSSGGNRFDLGMLCFGQQIWTSDDTDPIERLKIQQGLSYLYPLSVMGAHVSGSPNMQTLRETPLATRFHVAAFGCLGYELDLRFLTPQEEKDVQEQIAFYKAHRRLLQYGDFYRIPGHKSNKIFWEVVSPDKKEAIVALYQLYADAAESEDYLKAAGLNEGMYAICTREQKLYLKRFGLLLKHVLPIVLDPDGRRFNMLNRRYTLKDAVERYVCSTDALAEGIPLTPQFLGTGYNENIRMLGDYGSNLYVLREKDGGGDIDGEEKK